MNFYIYESARKEAFLGCIHLVPKIAESYDIYPGSHHENGWFPLKSCHGNQVSKALGEISITLDFLRTPNKLCKPEDFRIMNLIGKGTHGQVYSVSKKDTHRFYTMKVVAKKLVVRMPEGDDTALKIRTYSTANHCPFVLRIKFSFQTPTDIYLVEDYMAGGELFWHLQKEGRFDQARAKFYIAEIILAFEYLHKNGIIYRDLKPEHILLDANGHIAISDFGLSKIGIEKGNENGFCGTTEYLAPEVLLDEAGYTHLVDFWSLGVLMFEMCCGWSPFYAEDTQQMYTKIAFGKVLFPRDIICRVPQFHKGIAQQKPASPTGFYRWHWRLKTPRLFFRYRLGLHGKKSSGSTLQTKVENDPIQYPPTRIGWSNGTLNTIDVRHAS